MTNLKWTRTEDELPIDCYPKTTFLVRQDSWGKGVISVAVTDGLSQYDQWCLIPEIAEPDIKDNKLITHLKEELDEILRTNRDERGSYSTYVCILEKAKNGDFND